MGKLSQASQSQHSQSISKRKQIQKQNKKYSNNNTASNKSFDLTIPNETIDLQQTKKAPLFRQFVFMTNVQFYLNKMSSSPNGQFIDIIHKQWWGNYILLQTNHNYIQWLFPNSFQSRFNQAAKPLTKQQAKHFRQNLTIAIRYVRSYQMILEFFGMKLSNRVTGEITRTIKPRCKDRYDETLLSAYHNHLRVTRILCSLTQVGFAFYARQLCKFLKKQIYEHNGKLIRLKHMDVYKHWRPFEGDCKDRSNKINVEDTPNIYLRQLWKQQGYNPLVKERSKWSQVYNKNKPTITLQDESDDQKDQAKQNKNEQKQQNKSVSLKQKIQPRFPQNKQKQKISKINLQKDHQSETQQDQSSEQFSLSEESINQKQYGRRGTKQYQKFRRQLADSSDAIQKQKVYRLIRKQQQYEKNLQLKVKARLADNTDNSAKRMMNEIRKDYAQRLKGFGGARVPQTMQERQNRLMLKGKHIESSQYQQE